MHFPLVNEFVRRFIFQIPTSSGTYEYQHCHHRWQVVNDMSDKRGILSRSSQYCGFFYSQDDVPVSLQNSGEEMISISETEWEWNGESDNHGYVRQIEPYWFYFEAYF